MTGGSFMAYKIRPQKAKPFLLVCSEQQKILQHNDSFKANSIKKHTQQTHPDAWFTSILQTKQRYFFIVGFKRLEMQHSSVPTDYNWFSIRHALMKQQTQSILITSSHKKSCTAQIYPIFQPFIIFTLILLIQKWQVEHCDIDDTHAKDFSVNVASVALCS